MQSFRTRSDCPTKLALGNVGDNQVAVSDVDVKLDGLGDSEFIALLHASYQRLALCQSGSSSQRFVDFILNRQYTPSISAQLRSATIAWSSL